VDELLAEPNARGWANETRIGAKGTPWLATRRTAGVDVKRPFQIAALDVASGRIAVLPGKQIASGAPGAARTGSCACGRSSTARRASPIFSTWDADDPAFAALRRSELIGRPLGDEAFLEAISRRLNRAVTPRKRGRKPKGNVAGAEAKG
jgi:hypothetical protein